MIRMVLKALFGLGVLVLLLWFFANPGGIYDEIHVYDSSLKNVSHAPSDTLTILTFNLAYAFGLGSDGLNYTPKTKDVILERLKSVASLINDTHADIVLLQEVDFDANRSGNTNQSEFISKATGLTFVADVISWNARYVPFPYWPISYHFGKVKSGGAVISRFPVLKQEVQFLPKPDSNPWYYNWFYLSRYLQSVTLSLNNHPFTLLNMHLEAYDKTNKQQQATQLKNWVESVKNVSLLGGDMNSLPPSAVQVFQFDDEYGDDYRNDSTQTIIRSIKGFSEPVFTKNQRDLFTFPALNANRQLDYFFVNDSIQVIDYKVLNTGDLSDHLPILLKIVLPN